MARNVDDLCLFMDAVVGSEGWTFELGIASVCVCSLICRSANTELSLSYFKLA
jgi:hypothetical protein